VCIISPYGGEDIIYKIKVEIPKLKKVICKVDQVNCKKGDRVKIGYDSVKEKYKVIEVLTDSKSSPSKQSKDT
jgi:hypothetical protein